MRLLASAAVLVTFINWAHAAEGPAYGLIVQNCVDATNTVSPKDHVAQTLLEWRQGSQFAGIVVGSSSESAMQTNSDIYFASGQFSSRLGAIIKDPKEVRLFYSSDEKKACLVQRGEPTYFKEIN